jgi:hypothetical protein
MELDGTQIFASLPDWIDPDIGVGDCVRVSAGIIIARIRPTLQQEIANDTIQVEHRTGSSATTDCSKRPDDICCGREGDNAKMLKSVS